jgi:uncharacterized membrane protein YccC
MNDNLVKQSLRLGISVLITCAIAQHFDRINFVWYPVLAVIFVVDDQDENTIRAARGRILGTVTGGLVVFLVHTLLSGWIGILVSLLITIPLLRRLGWTSGLSTAVVITVMFLGIHDYTLLNWNYVLNRSIDTLVGICVALVIGRLLWPKDRLKRMEELHETLMASVNQRMFQHMQALQGLSPMPAPLNPGLLTRDILEIQRLINIEQQLGPRHRNQLTRLRWKQRISLWRSLQSHWILIERLLDSLSRKYQPLRLPKLAQYLDPNHVIGWNRLQLHDQDQPQQIGLAQRILLEEECTRFLRLINSQKRLNQVLIQGNHQ